MKTQTQTLKKYTHIPCTSTQTHMKVTHSHEHTVDLCLTFTWPESSTSSWLVESYESGLKLKLYAGIILSKRHEGGGEGEKESKREQKREIVL